MPADAPLLIVISLLLILGSAFFVAAEYSLVSSRRSRLETYAKKGRGGAVALVKALDNLSILVAGSQIAITMLGIGVGAVTEPFVMQVLAGAFGHSVDRRIAYAVSFLLVTFLLVVIGELVPKYATLRNPERAALLLYPPLKWVSYLLYPLSWLARITATGVLRGFGVKPADEHSGGVPKEELLLLVQSGGSEGVLEKKHAELVSRALRLDVLTAKDIMIHRLDAKWLEVSMSKEQVLSRLKKIPYSRLPVCRGDIDDLLGVVFVHDIVKHWDNPDFSLEAIMVPPIIVPENLPMGRIIETMRSSKTHMLVVVDEYGGTSGILTLEDVVEEVFGELEDRAEMQRPAIEVRPGGRVSARAEVRFDELIHFLNLDIDPGDNTDTLATLLIDALERVPKMGDSVETALGLMRVENMARSRITRVSIQVKPELRNRQESMSR